MDQLFVIDESTEPRNPAPELERGSLRLAAYNVLNFFTTLDDSGPICGRSKTSGCWGADNAGEYTRQLDKLVSTISIIDADIIGLVELENNPDASLKALVNGLNKVMQVSIAQERCYKAIKLYFTKSKSTSISKNTLLTLWREPTIRALVQKGLLIEHSGDKIGLRN